jgi:CheY-like chemotaxis protein
MDIAVEVPARKRILLVDDSATARLMICIVLQGEPYDVLTASDGVEALDKAHQNRPDLILLDVIMPLMDGIETCKRLRGDPLTHATPIIMLSGRDDEGITEASYAYGCNDFVFKPVDPVELLAKVHSCLGEWNKS